MKPYDPPAHTSTSYRWVGLRRASQDRLRRCRTLPPGEAEINVRKTARYAGEKTDPLQLTKREQKVSRWVLMRLDLTKHERLIGETKQEQPKLPGRQGILSFILHTLSTPLQNPKLSNCRFCSGTVNR